MEARATRAAAIATWALVHALGDVLGGVAALCSRDARRLQMRFHLAESVGMLVVVTLLCTLGTDGCASMECVILLVSLVWVAGKLGGNCTLGTRGMPGICTGVVESVATSSNWSGCACTWVFVASMMRWRSCAA